MTRTSSRSGCGCPLPEERGAVVDTAFVAAALARSGSVETSGTPGLSLADLPIGVRGNILAIDSDASPALGQRLGDLGFVAGTGVEAVRRAPLGDPVVYRVCGYDICLRRAQAQKIRVVSLG
ncbi:MAG TPA: FeoA family protein [Lacisediminihabitans sp.]|uniref:FeoA family protein n=1 Tax=Lacisediminihabitans sp. TaxID=2787631 RepID=UPI002EDB8F84